MITVALSSQNPTGQKTFYLGFFFSQKFVSVYFQILVNAVGIK